MQTPNQTNQLYEVINANTGETLASGTLAECEAELFWLEAPDANSPEFFWDDIADLFPEVVIAAVVFPAPAYYTHCLAALNDGRIFHTGSFADCVREWSKWAALSESTIIASYTHPYLNA